MKLYKLCQFYLAQKEGLPQNDLKQSLFPSDLKINSRKIPGLV
jgi:hypothetical protein